MKKVIVITGPTATGKTGLSVELAKTIDGEIISADSMQIYKYMDIGSAKPGFDEKCGILHYMMDFLDPSINYSVAEYKKAAEKCIEDILSRNKIPVITGGTGLYINSLVYNIDYDNSPGSELIRNKLALLAEKEGNRVLYSELAALDPQAAANIHPNNTRRLIRALEVCKQTQKTFTQKNIEALKNPVKYDYKVYMLTMNRDRLYDRINKRVDQMIEDGLEGEAWRLYRMGLNKNCTSLQGIGYKEFFCYFRGLCTFDESVDIIKRESRRYAKRQTTWMKKIKGVRFINMDVLSKEEAIIEISNDIFIK